MIDFSNVNMIIKMNENELVVIQRVEMIAWIWRCWWTTNQISRNDFDTSAICGVKSFDKLSYHILVSNWSA